MWDRTGVLASAPIITRSTISACGGVGSFVSETASWAAFAASAFTAAALLLAPRAGWANRGVGLAVVQSNTPRRCSASMMRSTSSSTVISRVRRWRSGASGGS